MIVLTPTAVGFRLPIRHRTMTAVLVRLDDGDGGVWWCCVATVVRWWLSMIKVSGGDNGSCELQWLVSLARGGGFKKNDHGVACRDELGYGFYLFWGFYYFIYLIRLLWSFNKN